jgi:hypothetical protein
MTEAQNSKQKMDNSLEIGSFGFVSPAAGTDFDIRILNFSGEPFEEIANRIVEEMKK